MDKLAMLEEEGQCGIKTKQNKKQTMDFELKQFWLQVLYSHLTVSSVVNDNFLEAQSTHL